MFTESIFVENNIRNDTNNVMQSSLNFDLTWLTSVRNNKALGMNAMEYYFFIAKNRKNQEFIENIIYILDM